MPLVTAARDGSRTAFEDLFENVLPELRAYVRLHSGRRIRDRESTSDLVQSICRQTLEDLHQFEGTGEKQLKKWLFTLAMNKILQKDRFHRAGMRSASREIKLPPRPLDSKSPGDDQLLDCYKSFCTPSVLVSANEEVARIEAVFDQLSEDYRQVITLACFLRMSHAEVAEELGRSEAATRMLLSRARAELAVRLAQEELGR